MKTIEVKEGMQVEINIYNEFSDGPFSQENYMLQPGQVITITDKKTTTTNTAAKPATNKQAKAK